MFLVTDLLVTVFPVQTGISEQEHNIPQSADLHFGDSIMLYALSLYKRNSYELFLTVLLQSDFHLLMKRNLNWLLQWLCKDANFHYQMVCKVETVIPNRSYSGVLLTCFGAAVGKWANVWHFVCYLLHLRGMRETNLQEKTINLIFFQALTNHIATTVFDENYIN